MFLIGGHVVCGSKGVCVIEQITRLNISGVDREREYYILKPLYLSGSTVYVPVDAPKDSLRRVMSREEAEELIAKIPELSVLTITNDKLSEAVYKECMKTNQCTDWLRVIKTIYARRQKRLAAGRKMTAVDTRYLRQAEDNLHGELAVALEMERSEVEKYICEKLEKSTLQV